MASATHPVGTLNARRWFIVAVAGILAAGCKGKGAPEVNPSADTIAEVTGDTAQLFYPEKSADSTAALVATRYWDDTPGHRWNGRLDCGDGSTCGTKTSVEFLILPHVDADEFDFRKILRAQAKSEFFAKLKNIDSVPYGPWRIGAGDSAYAYVGLRSSGDYRISLHDIKGKRLVTAQTAALCELKASHPFPKVDGGPFHCKGKADLELLYGPPYPATGDAGAALNNPLVRFASNAPLSAQSFALSGLWISCTGGCCEGSAFE